MTRLRNGRASRGNDRTSPGGSVIRSGALTLFGGIVAAAGGLLLTIVVARGLGVARAGVFFVTLGLFTILSNTLELGADTGLIRGIPRLRATQRSRDIGTTLLAALAPVAVFGIVGAVLVAHYSPTLARVFMQQGSTILGSSYLRDTAPYLAFAPLATVLIAGTRGFGSVVPFVAIQNIGMPLARPAAIAALIALGAASSQSVARAWGLPWVVAAALGGLILASQARRAQARDTTALPRGSRPAIVREFWSFASARAFAGTAEVTLVWLDVLLVGWLVGPVQAGIYATASRFVTTGTLALQASRIAISPELARLMSTRRHREAEALFHGATRAVIAASWPLYIGLACFSHVILRVFGHGFTAGATALSILSAAMLVDTFTGNIGTVILMAGSSRLNLLNAGVGLLVDVVLDVLLIPHYGATGAAIGWAASIVVINVLACVEVARLLGLRVLEPATNKVARSALLWFGIPGVALGVVAGHSLWALVAWLIMASVGYVSWWWRRRDDQDVRGMIAAFQMKGSAAPAAMEGTL